MPASGNVFVAWANNGAIYLSKNSAPGDVVSTGVAQALEPSLYVDANDVAHLAFQNGDIWYTHVP